MTAFYNEIDPFAAQWLRNLIAAGHIAPGIVDERDIKDIAPDELTQYTQCHFFAGIGVWSLALRNAGWPDTRPVWTGSCPCQPFSAAGRGTGMLDERHLWPAFHWLIEECRPPVVFGEQVASKAVNEWIDLVQDDLEGVGYRFAAVPFPAASVGAPHIRDRSFWVGDCDDAGLERHAGHDRPAGRQGPSRPVAPTGVPRGVADTNVQQPQRTAGNKSRAGESRREGSAVRLADADHGRQPAGRLPVRPGRQDEAEAIESGDGADVRPGPTNGFWRDADWLFCRDGKWRPVEPGTFPLAHGAPARVGRLRAYGNAIVEENARAFIECYIETQQDPHP